MLLTDHPPNTGFSIFHLQRNGSPGWRRTFHDPIVAASRTHLGGVVLVLDSSSRTRLVQVCPDTGRIEKHVLLPSNSITDMYVLKEWIALINQKGHLYASPLNCYERWHMIEPSGLTSRIPVQLYDRGDFWILAHRSVELVAIETGMPLGQLMDRPCESLIALPGGDLLVVSDDAVCRFRLGGHLSVLSSPAS